MGTRNMSEVGGLNDLHIIEYIVFGSLLVVSLSVGFFFAWKEKNQSADSYLLNNESMNPIAAGLSMFVSLVSPLTVIGLPVEVYQFGDGMLWRLAGGLIGSIILTFTFVPMFHKLQCYSVYSYLEQRYNNSKLVMTITLIMGVVGMCIHMMALCYLAALSLSTVTNISLSWTMLMLNSIAILYTMMGGMKAVIWTDVLQSGVLVFSLSAVSGKLWMEIGAEKIMEDVKAAGAHRVGDILNWDPTVRSSAAWFLGEITLMFFHIGVGQYFVQRYVSCATVKDAQKSIWVATVVSLIVGGLLIPLIGMASISYFAGCDPVLNNELGRHDALIPYLVTKLFSKVPGMTGLFISAAYSATLSTISTGLNAGATIMFKTIIPGKVSEERLIPYMRIFIVLFGCFITGGSLTFQFVSGTIIGFSMMVLGAIGAPTTGIFVLGIFTTKTHPTGILVGTITSQIGLVLKIIGGKYFPTPPEILNLTERNATLCGNVTSTLLQIKPTIPVEIDSVFVSDEPAYPWWHKIFWISNIGWNGIFCLLMFCIPAHLASLVLKDQSGYIVDRRLHISLFSGKFWPQFLHNAFQLDCHKKEHDHKNTNNLEGDETKLFKSYEPNDS